MVRAENKVALSRGTIDVGKAQTAGNGPALFKHCNAESRRHSHFERNFIFRSDHTSPGIHNGQIV